MAKSKAQAQTKATTPSQKVLNTVKDGRVTKQAQTLKAKAKEIVKAAVVKKDKKKPIVKDVSSEEEDSSSNSDDDSESEASEESEDEKFNGVNGARGHDDSSDSDDSDSSNSESDDEETVAAKPSSVPTTNGVTKAGAEQSDEDASFHSADEKPISKFEPDSDTDSDEEDSEDDSEDDSSSDDDDSDKEESGVGVNVTLTAAPVKVNGAATGDDSEEEEEESDDDSEVSDENDDAQELAPKKRKAGENESISTKKAKVDVDEYADQGPNGETKNLFIGRISWATDDDALYHEFSSFGNIVGCRVVYDRDSGKSKGFGYVEFEKLADAIAAKEAKHGALFDGRNINVDFSQPRSGKPKEDPRERAKRFGDVRGAPSETLFVGNLSFEATYDEIKEVFSSHGEISRISLPTDRESGQMKGFGYVSFNTIDEAKSAIDALSGTEIAGRAIRLDYATARAPADGNGNRGPPRGGFGGRSGSGGGFGGGFGARGGGGRGSGGRGRGGMSNSYNRGGFGAYQGKKVTF